MLRPVLAAVLAFPTTACASTPVPAALQAASAEYAESKPHSAIEGSPSPRPTGDAVAAAIAEYVAAANFAMRTGDTARFRQAVTSDCTCLDFAETIEAYAAESTRAVGAQWTLGEVRIAGTTSQDARAIVDVQSDAYEIRSPLDVEQIPARGASQFLRLAKEDVWRVADVDEL